MEELSFTEIAILDLKQTIESLIEANKESASQIAQLKNEVVKLTNPTKPEIVLPEPVVEEVPKTSEVYADIPNVRHFEYYYNKEYHKLLTGLHFGVASLEQGLYHLKKAKCFDCAIYVDHEWFFTVLGMLRGTGRRSFQSFKDNFDRQVAYNEFENSVIVPVSTPYKDCVYIMPTSKTNSWRVFDGNYHRIRLQVQECFDADLKNSKVPLVILENYFRTEVEAATVEYDQSHVEEPRYRRPQESDFYENQPDLGSMYTKNFLGA